MKNLRIMLLLAQFVAVGAPGPASQQSQMDVQNKWRALTPPPFQSDMLVAIGRLAANSPSSYPKRCFHEGLPQTTRIHSFSL
jgi:hypothetical protein